ncbi:(2Fe-2S)-binding protein [Niveispirillum sp. KHB5.9]|uniref:(2Fe-2S)-binding protein n=1 Tax=Niveispirillum sp. KHB5.9 TaxID=3400269 RepID=UPI003A892744
MYVCICNAINCKTVRKSVNDGAGSVASVFKSCGKTPQCGRCFTTIRDMVGESRAANSDVCMTHAIAAE